MEKVPYLLVLGKNEVADRTVSYRLHGEQQSTTVSMEDFLAMLQEDIRTKKLRQVVTAVSDGASAVSSAEEYLRTL